VKCGASAPGGDLNACDATISINAVTTSNQRVIFSPMQEIPKRQLTAASAFSVAFLLDRRLAAGDEDVVELRVRESSRRFVDAFGKIGHWHFESGELSRFVSNCVSQSEIAAAFSLQELRGIARGIAEGSAPVPPKPQQPAPVAVEPPPPTQQVFMIKSAKYRGGDERMHYCGQYEDAIMPPEVAQKALRCGAAVSITDDRRRHLRGARGGDFNFSAPDVVDLEKIDDRSAARYVGPNDPVAASANFRAMDRGPAITGTITVARAL